MKKRSYFCQSGGHAMRHVLTLALVMTVVSCNTTRYLQVYDIMPGEGVELRDGYPVYDDGVMTVAYDFWGDGGRADCFITNNGEENIYVDLAETFFVKNGLSDTYYKERTHTETWTSAVETKAVALSSGGAAMLTPFHSYTYGVMQGASSSVGNSLSETQQQIVVIPPGTMAFVGGHSILSGNYLTNRGYEHDPGSSNKGETEYTAGSSPLKLGNIITYRIGRDDEWHDLRNEFYLHRLTDYPLANFFKIYGNKKDPDGVCIWRYDDGTYDYSPLRKPTCFYFTYEYDVYKKGRYKTLLKYDEERNSNGETEEMYYW